MKRFFDILASGLAILALSPLLMPLALALRMSGEGFIFYRQRRVGLNGREFDLLKFATMLKDSPSMVGGTITTQGDPRVLPLGKLLRKTKLNELPQLFNILLGEMSFVGPRPQTRECFEMFPEDLRDKIYLSKPGLTGIGSIVFRDEEGIMAESPKGAKRCYVEDVMPHKAHLEVWYHENQSFRLDLKLIFITALVVAAPKLDPQRWLYGLPKPFANVKP